MRVIARAHPPRRRAAAQPWRLRRPEPVHRARRRVGDPGLLRASVRRPASLRGRSDLRDRTRPRRLARRQALRPRRRQAGRWPTSMRRKRALADQLGARWTTPGGRSTRGRRRARPVRAGRPARRRERSRGCAARSSPARPTTSSPTTASPICSPRAGSCGRPDFVANAGGIINIVEELTGDGYDPAPPRRRVRGIAETLREIFDHAEALGATPLAAAMELARRGCRPPQSQRVGSRPSARGARALALRRAAVPRRRACPGGPRASPPPPGGAPSGASSHASSSSSSTVRLPSARAATSRRSRSSRWSMYCVELGGRVVDRRTMPGAQQRQLALAQPAQRRQVGGQRARIGGDEHAPLAQHRVAGEARRRRSRTRGGRARARAWPRPPADRTRCRPTGSTSTSPRAAGRPGLGNRAAHRGHRLGVVGVVVGERDPAEPATALDLGGHGFDVLVGSRGPGSTSQAGSRPTIQRVGARQRERPRVGGPDPDELVSGKLDPRHPPCASSHPRSRQVPTPPPATWITCRAPWACSSDAATAARCPEEQITATAPAASISRGIPATS